MVPVKSKKRTYYPLFLDICGESAVVVGGGSVALRKVRELLRSGARITVVSPMVENELNELEEQGQIRIIRETFTESHLKDCLLSVAATDNHEINMKVSREALRRKMLVNVVDRPDLSNFIVPSILRRGDLTIAISTGGKSPALSRRLREDMEGIIGNEYGEYVELLGELREKVKEKFPEDPEKRRAIFDELTDGRLLKLFQMGDSSGVEVFVRRCMS